MLYLPDRQGIGWVGTTTLHEGKAYSRERIAVEDTAPRQQKGADPSKGGFADRREACTLQTGGMGFLGVSPAEIMSAVKKPLKPKRGG